MLAGVTACGTVEQLSAGQKLDKAFEKLGKEKSLSFELDLDADAATLKALDESSDREPGEEPLPDEAANLLSGAKVSFTVESKKPLAESADEKDLVGMAMKVSNPDGDLIEYRLVGDYAYFRSDTKALSKAFGAPLPTADELPPEAGALKQALEGKWVKISTKEMEEAQSELNPDTAGKPSPEPSLDAKTEKKLLEALRGVFARDVDFKTAGDKDGTEHITAVAPFRTLVTDLINQVRKFEKDLPPGMQELPTEKELKELPNEKASADFTLKNGELTEVYVDLAKLAENAKVKKFGLVLKMSSGEKPTAPAGATELNLDEVMSGFAGAMMQDEEFSEEDFPEEGFTAEELPEGGTA
ncbi:hypothetical protein AB0A69_15660 [Streptomyces sp. NPDC045431]|uniref:hypothetical protein n=1 Tax=Streptomyces sp. NPDC045431 TaxID=3155613 RepID=UPI00340EF704